MKIYALVNEFPISDMTHAILNGRLFRIRKDPISERMTFVDAITSDILIESGRLISDETDVTGIRTLVTSHDTVYKITSIERLLPTKGFFDGSAYDYSSLKDKELEYELEIKTNVHDGYESGYDVTVRRYRFKDVPMTFRDFRAFCQRQRLTLNRKDQVSPGHPWAEIYANFKDGKPIWEHRLYTPSLATDLEYESTCE